jgi:3-mercaptopyruvate sulfurtransferase SseA
MRFRLGVVPGLLLLLGAAVPPEASRAVSAQQPTFDVIKVAQLDYLLRKGTQIQLVDVRSRQEYLTRHIKNAVSIPLDTIESRAGEIPRQGLVVLY